MAGNSSVSCYLYSSEDEYAWGDCCQELSLTPKPYWIILLAWAPIEFALSSAQINGDPVSVGNLMGTSFLLGVYVVVALILLLVQFDWDKCSNTDDVTECYQGLVFAFYNSTAGLVVLILWLFTALRKFYVFAYWATRIIILPSFLWLNFDLALDYPDELEKWKAEGKNITFDRWEIVLIVFTAVFGGITHVLPMTLAYPHISFTFVFAMIFTHNVRVGIVESYYAQLADSGNGKNSIYFISTSVVLKTLVVYPGSLLIAFLAVCLSPLMALLLLLATLLVKIFYCCYDAVDAVGMRSMSYHNDAEDSNHDSDKVISQYSMRESQVERELELGTFAVSVPPQYERRIKQELERAKSKPLKKISEFSSSSAVKKSSSNTANGSSFLSRRINQTFLNFDQNNNESFQDNDNESKTTQLLSHATVENVLDEVCSKYCVPLERQLKNLCLFDPSGNLVMFAAFTVFLCTTLAVNHGVLLYSGSPYIKALELDLNARREALWFSCTISNFENLDPFGIVDFLGLAVAFSLGLLQLIVIMIP